MKKFLLVACSVFMMLPGIAQTASSVANGNWTNPSTWNCSCVPVNGYSVTISHSVTLNTNMMFSTGGININTSGSLIQDAFLNRDILINGGYFNNNGKANFRFFMVSSGAAFNTGSFTLTAFTNSVAFNNTGLIQMDSMYTAASFTNGANAKIIGDSITTASSFINNGRLNVTWGLNTGSFVNNKYHWNYSFTNSGSYQNYDSLILAHSFWNRVNFNNKPGAKFNIGKNFYNNNSGNAVFDNNSNVLVTDSWYNTDTIKGSSTGYFSVADTSANSGQMKGNFTFCDATPPGLAPYIDLNTGGIAPGIVFCAPTGIAEFSFNSFSLYPNPSNGKIFINNSGNYDLKVLILDINGKLLYEQYLLRNSNNEFNLNLKNGVYFVRIVGANGNDTITRKLIVCNE